MSYHFEYPRLIKACRPEGFVPPSPKFHVRWKKPLTTLICDYIAVQHSGAEISVESVFFRSTRASFARNYGPDSWEELRETDSEGSVNSIVVGYWTDPTAYATWKYSDSFNLWWNSPRREAEPVGYWRETMVVPYDRMETIFSEPHYRAGVAKTDGCELEAMYTAGYFGAMRDRLPISAVDPLVSPYEEAMPIASSNPGFGKRIRIEVPHNLTSIRSGQYWQEAPEDQYADYIGNLQPKLDTGMNYLLAHRGATGCLSLRKMANLALDGQQLAETSIHGYFLSLAHLEGWAANHTSHLEIYKHALSMRKKYGSARAVVTWHEVFVLGNFTVFEYVNCHSRTGLLRFSTLWGYQQVAI